MRFVWFFKVKRETLASSTLFRYGITNGIEIRLVNQFESIKNRITSEKENVKQELITP